MGKRHRNRVPSSARRERVGAVTGANASASWGWRGGVDTSTGFDGSKIRDSLRTLYPSGYDLDASALRARARVARWDSTQARGMIQRLVDNVIGTGLTLRAAPAWELIGSTMSDEQKRALGDKIDVLFRLWADSHEPDSTGRRNLAELQAFEFLNELTDGDQPVVFRYDGDSSRTSPLSLQFLDADQLDTRQTTYGTPKTAGLALEVQSRGNILKDGVEMTSRGELVAIYVLDPADPWGKPTRAPVWGKESGRRFVLLPAILDLPGQIRGVGPLANVVHELQKITDYSVAELEAAIGNAIFAGFISTEVGGEKTGGLAKAVLGDSAGSVATAKEQAPQKVDISSGGIWVGNLGKGQKLESFNTARPNVNFGAFIDAQMESIAASLSMPVEVWKEKFSQNYSASRASLILFWETVERWRIHVVSQFLAPVYEAWLREQVRMGRFPELVANGFGDDPIRTRAWLQADWIGDSMPSIDPIKEAQADDLRLAQCATTGERVALKYNRSDWWDNVKRRNAELAEMPEEKPAAGAARQSIPPSDDPESDQPAKEGA